MLRSHAEHLENDIGKIMRNEDPDKTDALLKKINEIDVQAA